MKIEEIIPGAGRITNVNDLKQQVKLMELVRLEKEEQIKLHAAALVEHAKPVNILKRTVVNSNVLRTIFSNQGLTGNVLQIGTAFLLKRFFKKKKK